MDVALYACVQRLFRLTAWAPPRGRGPLGTRLNQIIPANGRPWGDPQSEATVVNSIP